MLLDVRDLRVRFGPEDCPVRAVDGISFTVAEGQTVALVGESGCGKSVTALAMARLLDEPAARFAGGQILFAGRDVLGMGAAELRALRGAGVAYVFQDPATSLNPVMAIGRQVGESVRLHQPGVRVVEESIRLLELVGVPDAVSRLRAYPHELSGGQRQRVAIAMALACRPRLLIADEPTTALDVTVQAQILERIVTIQREARMAVLLITHNFGLVAGVADWVHVMYAGAILEGGPTEEVLRHPAHPYTRGLLDAVPRVRRVGGDGQLVGIPGRVPHPARLPPGCRFAPRCAWRAEGCEAQEPALTEIGAVGGQVHAARCWYPLGGRRAVARPDVQARAPVAAGSP